MTDLAGMPSYFWLTSSRLKEPIRDEVPYTTQALRQDLLRVRLAWERISLGVGMPSRDFANEDVFSSRMMSVHNSTHSSQMNTVGPAMSLRTSCWLLPQNEQYRVFFESLPPTLLIPLSVTQRRSPSPQGRSLSSSTHAKK